jgi:DNA-directed RNA polymerase specialized sigma24 family protein
MDAHLPAETVEQVTSSAAGAHKWTLTKDAFDRLLVSFGTDRESGAQKYIEIRDKLVRFFQWRGCPFPEEHADETFNRVAKKISEGEEIRNPSAYVIGVARLLVLEIIKAHSRQREALDELKYADAQQPDVDSEAHIDCLQRCLQQLSATNRELIIQYYQGDKRAKIDNRRLLCERLGMAINSLRMRALRVREKLQVCVEECVERGVA